MENKDSQQTPVRIELTEEQKRQVKDAIGREPAAIRAQASRSWKSGFRPASESKDDRNWLAAASADVQF